LNWGISFVLCALAGFAFAFITKMFNARAILMILKQTE
jgi:hypothetical protein